MQPSPFSVGARLPRGDRACVPRDLGRPARTAAVSAMTQPDAPRGGSPNGAGAAAAAAPSTASRLSPPPAEAATKAAQPAPPPPPQSNGQPDAPGGVPPAPAADAGAGQAAAAAEAEAAEAEAEEDAESLAAAEPLPSESVAWWAEQLAWRLPGAAAAGAAPRPAPGTSRLAGAREALAKRKAEQGAAAVAAAAAAGGGGRAVRPKVGAAVSPAPVG